MPTLSRNLPITGTAITVTLPAGTFFVTEPAVLVTVHGAPTDVDVELVHGAVAGVGEVYTAVRLTFAAAAVGKRFSLAVIGE